MDTFEGSNLGGCESFDVGASGPASVQLEMEHSGFNGGHLEWGKINAKLGETGKQVSLKCNISKKLDGKMKEIFDCAFEGQGCSSATLIMFILLLLHRQSVHTSRGLTGRSCHLRSHDQVVGVVR